MNEKKHFDLNTLVEVTLVNSDDFLIVKETLTRIGVTSKEKQELYQSCHILHKQGKYYIVHFKELFALDGRPTNYTEDDKARRNTIANLLEEWGLIKLVDANKSADPTVNIKNIKILPFGEKDKWNLVPKYQIGNKH